MGRKPTVVNALSDTLGAVGALAEMRAELDAMLALMDRTDALAMQAREIAANGDATYAEAKRWIEEREAVTA